VTDRIGVPQFKLLFHIKPQHDKGRVNLPEAKLGPITAVCYLLFEDCFS
jgi:hypothetical protein